MLCTSRHPSSHLTSPSPFTPIDLHLFSQGTHDRIYEKLGAHVMQRGDAHGYYFAVWAPNAQCVSVVGSFNGWDDMAHPMQRVGSSGIWETFIANIKAGTYKYALIDCNGQRRLKADPYARSGEYDKGHASILCAPLSDYVWHDGDWMTKRTEQNLYEQPLSIYEVHADSWKRNADNKPLTYRELAYELVAYLKQTGFTQSPPSFVQPLGTKTHDRYRWGITGYSCLKGNHTALTKENVTI